MWVARVHTYLLKAKALGMSTYPICSWDWRKILKLREMVKPPLSHSIGNGVRTVLWHGNWHPKGASFQEFEFRLEYEAVSSYDAKFSSILQDDNLICPPDRSDQVVVFQAGLSQVRIAGVDSAPWILSKSSMFSYSSAWNKI